MSEDAEKLNSVKKNGGARPGAGRKRKHDKNGTAIDRAERQIRDRLPDIVDKMIELAMGVMVEERTLDGHFVYQRPPEYKAAAYLIDRIMGKPTERRILEFDLDRPLSEMSDDELRAIAES